MVPVEIGAAVTTVATAQLPGLAVGIQPVADKAIGGVVLLAASQEPVVVFPGAVNTTGGAVIMAALKVAVTIDEQVPDA